VPRSLDDIVVDPAFAGLSWSIDCDAHTPRDEREQAHVTAAMVAKYLREHPINRAKRPDAPEFLIQQPASNEWFVRWPNGSLRWETAVSLVARGFTLPSQPILGTAERS
jgi:hypothetical protein